MASSAADADYQSLVFDYARSADQDATAPVRHHAIIVGAGPVGLATAIDLAQQGITTLLLDDDDRLSTGSRAICFAKRTLEIFDRLGCGHRMVDKGVTWNVGKVFFHDEPVYSFNLLPEGGHGHPAFINLQQYYVEGYLLERAKQLSNLEIRWKNKIAALSQTDAGIELGVETPEGNYSLHCDWLVAADGAKSAVRGFLGLTSEGQTFRDRFLIADVRMEADFPTERWFWFDPPFHPNQSVLLHQQPDGVWRIDFQLGWDADPVAERQPDRVIPRVQALLGRETRFDLEWVSVYTFACLRMDKFRHNRVLFAGDSAHGVSPFGARGANSGVQDADNLAWKLGLVLKGLAPETLLDTYDSERVYAADENILNSTRSTDFITPKNEASRAFRDATLQLAKDCSFARRLVNSGRLSIPSTYDASPLNTQDTDDFVGSMVPGAPATDAPVRIGKQDTWFLRQTGNAFTGIYFTDGGELPVEPSNTLRSLGESATPMNLLLVVPNGVRPKNTYSAHIVEDVEGLVAKRYDAKPGTFYLLRPDQHVCGRWRNFDAEAVHSALKRATGHPGGCGAKH
ncbi:MAG TPA: FAD-dependent oxidoreductase [Candidatus Acidoferrum sp.]|nr:FAD-dependent oxidoreductase [Candidatus Acidoferrum sp.]